MDTDSIKLEIFRLQQRVRRIVRRKGIVEWDTAIHAVAKLCSQIRILESEIRKAEA